VCAKLGRQSQSLNRARPRSHHLPFAEFKKIALATGIGFAVMGFIGFSVKLVHIPINNFIVGGGSA
jgi:hypothetical protein